MPISPRRRRTCCAPVRPSLSRSCLPGLRAMGRAPGYGISRRKWGCRCCRSVPPTCSTRLSAVPSTTSPVLSPRRRTHRRVPCVRRGRQPAAGAGRRGGAGRSAKLTDADLDGEPSVAVRLHYQPCRATGSCQPAPVLVKLRFDWLTEAQARRAFQQFFAPAGTGGAGRAADTDASGF